ncbi:MAG: hypothetical protein ABIP95_09230 [Pelobium sp.]
MDAGVTIFSIAYIVILIVPGIIFKRFYFQGAFSKQFNSGLFADRIITSLFWGILVQIISLISFSRFINIKYVDFKTRLLIFYTDVLSNQLPNLSLSQLLNTLFYALYSVFLAAVLGFLFFKIVRSLKLDINLPAFRFNNHWHYYFKGEILQTKEFSGNSRGKVISTEVDVMLKDDDGKSNLFSGLLTQYTLNHQNELESLYLTGSTRYSQTLGEVKAIPGDMFIIPYTTVQNLNIRYNFQVKKKTEIFKYIVLVISALVLIASLSYPWFTEIIIWRKVVGTFMLFINWLVLSTILVSFFEPSNGATKTSTRGILILIALLAVLIFLANLILQIF